jgi:succinate-semialdehyde dehydrogenase/glutarate-semialdehyde dehydrogenase
MKPNDMQTLNYIAGHWQASQDGREFDVRNPADDTLIARVADGGAADARLAADAASQALPAWKARTARERCLILKKWQALVERDAEKLAQLISREQGKPLAEARGEIAYSNGYIEWYAEEGVRAYGEIVPAPVSSRRLLVVREAVGVVAVITPWNFPAAMIARKIAPALAAGCTVLAKPAEDTPLTSLALVALAEEAGVPPGVLNIVPASRERTPEVAGEWLADPRVRKISFTGSTAVGKLLARESAATLKKLSLELGGNAPFIVFEDADIAAAVDGLMAAKFRNGGQTCVSPNRVYVHEAVHDRFVDKLAARVGALRVGPATWPQAEIGPMINARAVDKIERHVQDAAARGATVVVGGHRVRNDVADGPNYYAPTVLTGATKDMALSCEETFGPVVPVFRFSSEDEVVREANDTPFGLAGYFYSNDVKRIWRVAAALETGMVGINEGAIAAPAAPFGGVKESGYGREGSHWGLDEYMHTKYLCQGNLM